MKDYQHVVRLGILIAIALIVFIVGRRLLLPATFGQIGHYRAAALDAIKSKPVRHAGQDACVDCHSDVFETKSKSRHAGVHCESCHGPALLHTEDPDSPAARPRVPAPEDRRVFCGACHKENVSRPKFMPQVHLDVHHAGQPCTDCHNPHSPDTAIAGARPAAAVH